MKTDPYRLLRRLQRKAFSSLCTYKVAALGIDYKGICIGIVSNYPRPGNITDVHAEQRLIYTCPPTLKTIVVARVGLSGEFRPIHPCRRCAALALKKRIKIVSVPQTTVLRRLLA